MGRGEVWRELGVFVQRENDNKTCDDVNVESVMGAYSKWHAENLVWPIRVCRRVIVPAWWMRVRLAVAWRRRLDVDCDVAEPCLHAHARLERVNIAVLALNGW
jgi:hypothetical protein